MHDRAAPPQRDGARPRLRRRHAQYRGLPRPARPASGTSGSTTSARSATTRTAMACSPCGGPNASASTWSRACRAACRACYTIRTDRARRAQLHLLALGLGGARHAARRPRRAGRRGARRLRSPLSLRASRSRSSIRRSARRWSRSPIAVREHGGRVAFDGNYRPVGWPDPRRGARRVRPDARAGRHRPADARRRAGAVRREGRARNPPSGCTGSASPRSRSSSGQQGCFLSSAQFTGEIPAEPVDAVVDSTAAGDSFNAGYLAARLLGAEPARAARLGNRARRARHRLSRRDHPGRGDGGHPARVDREVSPPVRARGCYQ